MNAASQRENSGNLSRVGVGKSKQIFLQTGLCNRKKSIYSLLRDNTTYTIDNSVAA